MRSIEITGHAIGDGAPPYVIAELSGNHNGSLDRALEILDCAAAAGANAVKLQTYTADTITIKSDRPEFTIASGLWKGHSLHDLYAWAHTPWSWHKALFERGRERGVQVFSSPFDRSAVDFLEDLGAPAYKIASFEATDLPLISYAASTGKPLIISTGLCNEDEIADALAAARDAGNGQVALLYCVSGYPTPVEQSNLRTIPDMISRFGVPIGLSDHTLGTATAVAAIALGAAVIEKHVTLRRDDGGPDAAFSLEPEELTQLCGAVRDVSSALGRADYALKDSEKPSLALRRSLYVVADIAAGDPITEDNVRSIRPANGIPAKFYLDIIGRKAGRDLRRGEPLGWQDMEEGRLVTDT